MSLDATFQQHLAHAIVHDVCHRTTFSLHSATCFLVRTWRRKRVCCRYVRPQFVDESAPAQLKIVQGRHPVLDVALDSPVVPNDTQLMAGGPCALVITGPNMGGKSCYIRQAALIAIMAQVLHCTAPTQCHSCILVARLFCRIGLLFLREAVVESECGQKPQE